MMMEPYTIGHNFYEGAKVPIKVCMDSKELPDILSGTCYKIMILEEGTGIITINGKKIIVHAPYIIILNEEETLQVDKMVDMKLHVLLFQPNILDRKFEFAYLRNTGRQDVMDPDVQSLYLFNIFLLRDGSLSYHYHLTQVMCRRVLSLIESIQQEFKNQSSCYWICRGRSYLLELLCYLSRRPLQEEFGREESLDFNMDKLEDILLYIHTNYHKKITLKDTVESIGINRTTINNLFNKYVGMSFISYLIKLRIEAASLMLKETGLPISEIAYRVGYEDIANFNRSFKKVTGYTPGNYRKQYSWLLQM